MMADTKIVEKWYDKYKVDIPEGSIGEVRVERMTLTDADVAGTNMRAMLYPGARIIPPGTYTRLMFGSACVMSDTPAEIRDHVGFMRRATGNVLIHGLGLGMVARACMRNTLVNQVTVVEKSKSVIDLVAPHYTKQFGDKFEIICDDAYTWKPEKGRRWECAWHDIWYTISGDNLAGMTKLHRRFGGRVEWQESWAKDLCKRYASGRR